ncbi:MAG: fatty acid desaturase [Planctomycetes bacterium]|nr:fatty acid desaturase [Planctomycetota bacterium]
MNSKPLDWTNVLFIGTAHLLALAGVVWLIAMDFHWQTLVLAIVWLVFSSISITGGYHRLFSHPTYKASWPLRLFYLCFGAAGVQNSALKWSSDHRVHHAKTDTVEDPYNINQGFWWAHIAWILHRDDRQIDPAKVKDLMNDRLVVFQHKYYLPLAIVFGAVLPFSLGLLWGDPWGALLVAGFLRLVLQWHATFSVNSFTHMIGSQPYSTRGTARDSFLAALITMGEGYHNFHHKFQADYRNGIRWYHFDPTKWWVYCLSKVGVTRDLRRTPKERIESARRAVAAGNG